jgi:ABC-type multidrug transport system fused ATPase/permease subunit
MMRSPVDGRTEHQILHNLRQWGDGRTVIISAHRLSALTEASEILVMQHGHIAQRGQHETLAEQPGWYRDMYRYQQLEAALDDAPSRMRRPPMRKLGTMWPTLKRLLAYGSPWRKPLSVAVLLLWIAAIAEVSGPLLISYFIDNMVAKSYLPLGLVAGLGVAYVGLQAAAGLHYAQSLLFNRAAVGVVQQLRTDVMDAALRQPLSEFDTQPVGQ